MGDIHIVEALLNKAKEYGLLVEVVNSVIDLAMDPSTQSVVADTDQSIYLYCVRTACDKWSIPTKPICNETVK